MPYNPSVHHRRSIRYEAYDYALPGYYFVTLLTYQRERLFGSILDDEMHFSLTGECARAGLVSLSRHFNVLYYERIIRNDQELDQTRAYILQNPETWAEDQEEQGQRAGTGRVP